MTGTRDLLLVELVSPAGAAVGSATVAQAHTAPGLLHRAFSVLLVDGGSRTLLQQRAGTKSRFPLRWANACCGHPAPGEPVPVAAARRLVEELGVCAVALREVGVYYYQALDPATGLAEHEYDHVLVGRVPADLEVSPNPDEVAATMWVDLAELHAALEAPGDGDLTHAPWLRGALSVALGSSVRLVDDASG